MKYLPVLALHAYLFFAAISDSSAVSCRRPPLGRYVVGRDGMECVALIKETCGGMKSKNTRMWKPGVNVREYCSKIRPMTAIATFSGPHYKYAGGPYKHAAIFSSCDEEGIWVFDQWNGSRGVRYRQLRYDGPDDFNNGSNYYTIVI